MTDMARVHRARSRAGASTREVVYDVLRRQIIDLELPPGTALSEAEIGSRFGVSRTPVRESLLMLAGEGLVEVFPQRGSFVGPINYADVVAAQFVREALECAALEQGAAAIGAVDIAALRGLLDEQRTADARGDASGFFRLDESFHRTLMAVGGHESAWSIVSQAKAHMDRARRLSLPAGGKMTALIGQHARVVDELANGEPAAAVEALRHHLRVVLADVASIREEHGDLFDTAGERT